MEYNENYGPDPEGLAMEKYYAWINSDDPAAVAKRKSDEEKQQQYILSEKQKELDYQTFLRDNPDIVQKCKEQAMKQLGSITERYLRAAFESNKLKANIRKILTK